MLHVYYISIHQVEKKNHSPGNMPTDTQPNFQQEDLPKYQHYTYQWDMVWCANFKPVLVRVTNYIVWHSWSGLVI